MGILSVTYLRGGQRNIWWFEAFCLPFSGTEGPPRVPNGSQWTHYCALRSQDTTNDSLTQASLLTKRLPNKVKRSEFPKSNDLLQLCTLERLLLLNKKDRKSRLVPLWSPWNFLSNGHLVFNFKIFPYKAIANQSEKVGISKVQQQQISVLSH